MSIRLHLKNYWREAPTTFCCLGVCFQWQWARKSC
jgi:hypothetical protein